MKQNAQQLFRFMPPGLPRTPQCRPCNAHANPIGTGEVSLFGRDAEFFHVHVKSARLWEFARSNLRARGTAIGCGGSQPIAGTRGESDGRGGDECGYEGGRRAQRHAVSLERRKQVRTG